MQNKNTNTLYDVAYFTTISAHSGYDGDGVNEATYLARSFTQPSLETCVFEEFLFKSL